VVYSFSEVAVADSRLEPATKLPGIENLYIITTGTVPGNPLEVLNSDYMSDLINKLRSEYDIVLIDSPPVLPVADSLVLGEKADGILLVYQLGHLPQRALMRAKKQIQALGIHIVGVIINNIRPEYKSVAPVYISKEYMRATKNAFKE